MSSETGNVVDIHAPVDGWVGTSRDRGSIEILWDCCFTVLLCCWVSTHPNASSPSDRWYHHYVDKFHIALLGLLGPDFLFAIAVGQLSSARRSVQLCNRAIWTYRHAFFVDMGGLFLRSPDYPEGFPITAEELHYLVKYDHVDFPDMESMRVDKADTADTLSSFLDIIHMKLLSRSMKHRLWDRVPPYAWEPAHPIFLPLALLVAFGFGASFLSAWNFYFPTDTEKLLWRIFASYHAFFCVQGGLYYAFDICRWHQRNNAKYENRQDVENERAENTAMPNDLETAIPQISPKLKQRIANRLHRWAMKWRNSSADQDPDMAIPLRVSVPMSVLLFFYICGRLFVYIEDFYSLRRQPAGVYLTVNRFMPFSG
ncbi:tannase subunit [Colletotrichum kahawae]|uniref:Tannase subunit n=1 Tax=Colletotrichum kahawae TaxID=34407 RepID=A0AAD9YN25_COLKA|nr:tannase subunit [Colletotrichum kahawae]